MNLTRALVRSLAVLVVLTFASTAATAYADHPQMAETRLTTDTAAQSLPAMSGEMVVYQDLRNGNNDIYLYNLATGIEARLTSDPSAQTKPAISGVNVVYQDLRNGNSDIYLYNLTTRSGEASDYRFVVPRRSVNLRHQGGLPGPT